jgi:hypothetical protein
MIPEKSKYYCCYSINHMLECEMDAEELAVQLQKWIATLADSSEQPVTD